MKELEFSVTPEGEAELEAARTGGELAGYLLARCFLTKAFFAHQIPQGAIGRGTSTSVCEGTTNKVLPF